MAYARSLVAAWDAARPPQRVVFSAIVAVVAIAIGVFFVATPLRDAIERAKADVARNRLVLDVARSRVAENASLARGSPPIHGGDLRAAIERVMTRNGLQAAPSGQKAGEGRLSVVIAQARFDALVRALDALARDEGVHVVEATLTALVDPGTVRADLSFGR